MNLLIIYLLIGSGIGAAFGYFGKCAGGTCPLTSTWWRGAIYGAVIGGGFYLLSGRGAASSMNKSTPNVKHIGEADFDKEVVEADKPVLVDFYATWCGPCRALAPRIEKVAAELAGSVKFVKVNIDQAPNVAGRFNIEAVPTLLFFKNGKVVDKQLGGLSADALKARLEALLATGGVAAAQ